MSDRFDSSWDSILKPMFQSDEMKKLSAFVQQEREAGQVFPPNDFVFNAFRLTPLSQVKVVILGQDPYHNDGQAHGLSFSVPAGIAVPPSLQNIYKELQNDIPNFQIPNHGDLSHWAKQGVLLLNATLTVRAHVAGSHQKKGWEKFTDSIIRAISDQQEHVVFILWGAYAAKKAALIDQAKHLVLTSVHPSPLSVYRGFYGSKPFSKTNDYLQASGKKPIDWQI
ncbi:uracil-DNA glycosylase [Sphingobacterium kyonggiense]|uniref:Uracil-DNA glycosylase n=1 Tax=Sphingobacterium kyonggiense TaxID=714075 RepID=A0ABP7YE33_9SPHI